MQATALAHSNIALVKYWGKKDTALNIPAVGSISITLDALWTKTSVQFDAMLKDDVLELNDEDATDKETIRVSRFLDLVREAAGIKECARIQSKNNFPTSAGLASSASAFAALALAATNAAGLDFPGTKLSEMARKGSGSAARSIFGGYVEMSKGSKPDGSDAIARQIASADHWPLILLIAVTSEAKKKTGSTDGMELSRLTSPYYTPWVESSPADMQEMRQAIAEKDYSKLGTLSEFSALKMHALAIASDPGLLYWNGTTVEGMHLVRSLRQKGHEAYFTIDAGPQLKVLCQPDEADIISNALENLEGVKRVIRTGIGGDARLNEEF